MIRLIKFAAGPIARFSLTPSIISQIPEMDDMILQFGEKKFEQLTVHWTSLEEDPELAHEEGVENWNQLVNQYISNDFDLHDTKILIIARFSPVVLETRRMYLERYESPDVLGSLSRHLSVYCPLSRAGRKHKDEFDRWIVV